MTGLNRRDWGSFQLHEVCQPKQWQTIKKSEMTETGYPVYGANGIIGRYHSYNHSEPTILIGCRGSCGVVKICEPNSWVTGNAMALDELDTTRVDLCFLFYALRFDGLNDAITGTSQPQITQKSLNRVHLPLPPMEEQRRIAAVLDAADTLRTRRRQTIEWLNSLAQSIFSAMFPSGHETVVEIGQFVESIDKWNPRTEGSGTFVYIDIGSVDRNTKAISQPTLVQASQAPSRARQLVSEGDVLVSTVRPNLNAVARVEPNLDGATASTGFCVLRSRQDVLDSRYLYRWVQGRPFVSHLEMLSSGASYPAVSDKIVKEALIPLPPIEEQQRFGEIVDEVEELRQKCQESLALLDTLFASLQQRAFRGEL